MAEGESAMPLTLRPMNFLTKNDATAKLKAAIRRGEQYAQLCQRYHLSPDVPADVLHGAVRRQGHADAILDMTVHLQNLAKANKRLYTGDDPTLDDTPIN